MYAKAAWTKVVKVVKISTYSCEALLKGFDQTWGYRNIRCRWDQKENVFVMWWLGGLVGCPWWSYCYLVIFTLYMTWTPRILSPFKVGASSLGSLTLALWPSRLLIQNTQHTTQNIKQKNVFHFTWSIQHNSSWIR